MASFDYAQLEGLALSVGVSTDLAPTMAAIAMAESRGCQYALAGPVDVRPVKECHYRQTTGEQSYGLWQINIGARSDPQLGLFDPHQNALAMAAKLLNQGLGAWTTYRDGAYKQYLVPGTLPQTPPPPTLPTPTPGGYTDTTQAHVAFTRLQLSIMRDLPRDLNAAGATLRAARRHLARASRVRR